MIRSLAALFAKKTAIVAITGVTVIGGATFALAVEGDTSQDQAVDTATADDAQDPTTTTPESTTTTPESTTTTVPEEGEEQETLGTTAAGADDEGQGEGEGEDEDDVKVEVEDSHGAMVSEAARNICHKPENITAYGNHGQCVKAFAHGEGVDHSEPADPPLEADPGTSDAAPIATQSVDAAPETEPAVKAAPPAGKGKPAHAEGKGNGGGAPAGKGKKS